MSEEYLIKHVLAPGMKLSKGIIACILTKTIACRFHYMQWINLSHVLHLV